jgi:hypothetical protein
MSGSSTKPRPLTQEQINLIHERFEISGGDVVAKVDYGTKIKVKKGTVAGCAIHRGYRLVWVGGGRQALAHRVAWVLHTGQDPWPMTVDHIDNNPSNNCPSNLRLATMRQQSQNCTSVKGSSSRFLGVYWQRGAGKWAAQIVADGKKKYLGMFTDEISAAIAYNKAAEEHHGEFANLNNVSEDT